MFFTFGASSSIIVASHWASLAITIASLLFTLGTLAWGAKHRRGFGPFLLCLASSPFIMSNDIVSLLEDYNLTGHPDIVKYFTWIGVGAMMYSTLWNASADYKAREVIIWIGDKAKLMVKRFYADSQ